MIKKQLYPTLSVLCMLLTAFTGCANTTTGQQESKQTDTLRSHFTLPNIPAMLASSEERADYLVLHYWDHYNFADTTLIFKPEITEQAFADFVQVLPHAKKATQGINTMLTKAMTGSRAMFDHFVKLSEKYLYDPNSPMRNEELYIPVLQYIIVSNKVADIDKIRPKYQLEMAMKNRGGDTATDFTYTLANGRTGKLSQLKSDYTILFFNNPDCHDCNRIKEYMTTAPAFQVRAGRLAIVALYPDADLPLWLKVNYPSGWINGYDAGQVITKKQLYDLKAIPTLYLLDCDKRVILKDTTIEQIEQWLTRKQLNN